MPMFYMIITDTNNVSHETAEVEFDDVYEASNHFGSESAHIDDNDNVFFVRLGYVVSVQVKWFIESPVCSDNVEHIEDWPK